MSTAPERVGFGPRFAVPLLIGPALNPINTTMISVALVPIAAAVGVSAATAIWLVAILYLVSSVCQPAMGKLADQFGPRRVYLSGLAVVMVAGAIPLASPTFSGALVARILIGAGTSAAYPSAMTFLSDQSTRLDEKTPQVLLSALSISSLVTAAVGPVLGGILIEAFGWQSIFLVNIPLAGTAFVLALLWLPADGTRTKAASRTVSAWETIDPVGIVLFAVAVVSSLFFLLDLSATLYGLIPVAAVAVFVLLKWERRAPHPFIDVEMLAENGALVRTYLRLALVFTAGYLVIYGVTQWTQAEMGLGSGAAGLLQLPAVVVAAVASALVMRTSRLRAPLVVAAAAPLAGGLLILTLTSASPVWYLAAVVALFGLSQGLGSLSNQAALYRQAPIAQIGTAAGLSRTAVMLGAIIASSVIGIVFGQAVTDASVHAIGWIIAVLSAAALALTVADRSLTGSEDGR